MKKHKHLIDFMEGIEMTMLPQENQILLASIGGAEPSGPNSWCVEINNCNGGNCVKGCSC